MASWKRIITTSDDSAYKNSNVSATDIDSNVSDTEFGYLNGVTSGIQAQIDSAATSGGLSSEQVQDIAGPLVASGGTKTGITITYDDANNDMDFVVANQVTASAVAGVLTAGSNVTIANDGTISSSFTNTTYTAGTGITLSGTQFSIGQDVATTATPTFAQLTVDDLTSVSYTHLTLPTTPYV